MKMLMLPRYGVLGASSRLRTLQYVPALRAAGIDVEVSPLLNDAYVRGLCARSIRISGCSFISYSCVASARENLSLDHGVELYRSVYAAVANSGVQK